VPDIGGVHVQTHGGQPPVAGLSNDFLSIGDRNLTGRLAAAVGWFSGADPWPEP